MRMSPIGIYVNAWPPDCGTTWEGLGVVNFLEEVCFWWWALRFQKPTLFPLFLFLCLEFAVSKLSSQLLPLRHACLTAIIFLVIMIIDSTSFGTVIPKLIALFFKLTWSWCLFLVIKKKLRKYFTRPDLKNWKSFIISCSLSLLRVCGVYEIYACFSICHPCLLTYPLTMMVTDSYSCTTIIPNKSFSSISCPWSCV